MPDDATRASSSIGEQAVRSGRHHIRGYDDLVAAILHGERRLPTSA